MSDASIARPVAEEARVGQGAGVAARTGAQGTAGGPVAARPRARGRLLRPVLMLGGIAAVIVVSLLWWLNTGAVITIDNAYVRAAKLMVSTDVPGIVQSVDVREGEAVRKGQVLYRLDPRQYQIALDGAKARLAQVVLTIESMKADYQRMLRDAEAKAAAVASDTVNFDRYAELVKTSAASRSAYDDARFKLAADQAALAALRDQAKVQLAKLDGNPDIRPEDTPDYRTAAAAVAEAQRQLDHTEVRATFDGVVTQVDSIQPGTYLAAAAPGMALVSTTRLWVEANPKETELTWVKPGDKVRVTVDTYPGHVWAGHVSSISPASGAEFSLLPAQNSSGNWVKVVQRIPLRVVLDLKPGEPQLRAGMSVEAAIDTGHVRHLSDLLP